MNLTHIDDRGKLFFPIKDETNHFKQCTISINKKFVFRGIHINNFSKLVTCVQGKILDIIINFDINSDDYLIPKYFDLDPNTELFEILVPKGYGHAFLSLEENSILVYHLEEKFIDNKTKHIHYLDPFINISLPCFVNKNNIILSEKDNVKNFVYPIDYIVFGPNGFLGFNIVDFLKKDGKHFITTNVRLHEIDKIMELFFLYKPKYVINCAGITGIPNILWCDDNKTETIENNITYQLTMADICKKQNIHLTIFGSGGIFKNDKIYSDTEIGNNFSNYYGECRILLENIVKNYDNVLYLRINYPISSKPSNKNLLTKLLTYHTIDDVEISLTYIDNLFPILFQIIEENNCGICNFTNPGVINLIDIMNIYNETLFKKNETNMSINVTVSKEIIVNSNPIIDNRSFSKLLSSDIVIKNGALKIKDAIQECCEKYSQI
jgi:dTDP-4-dehydrorhamnose 3,5-epimerase-like enzyme/dTDP-4-dehydrorhamnose reductase